jgi:hypothetical protein
MSNLKAIAEHERHRAEEAAKRAEFERATVVYTEPTADGGETRVTMADLRAIFDKYTAGAASWKDAVCAAVPTGDVARFRKAVEFYHGGVTRATRIVNREKYLVENDGYAC